MNLSKNNGEFIKSLVFFSLLMSFSGLCLADAMAPSHRANSWELFLGGRYVDSIDLEFKGGAKAKINEETGFAWGFGYNYTEKLAFSFDAGWDSMGYSATAIDENGDEQQYSGKLNTSRINFSGTYYFMATRLSPYVGASFGWVFTDTNVPTGPPTGGCWWDPWWGYICSSYQPTKTSTDFTYGASLGVRFDVTKAMFLRGSIGYGWIGTSDAKSTPSTTNGRFEVGFKF